MKQRLQAAPSGSTSTKSRFYRQIGYCPTVAPSPKDLIERALALVPSQRVLGLRLQMSKTRANRIAHGERLSVTNCLRLADLLNESPSVVLRAYRYHAEADILERAYRARGRVPRKLAEIHEALDQLEPEDARLFGAVLKRWSAITGRGADNQPQRV